MQGMQGLEEAESENLAALGMHVSGGSKSDEEEEEEVGVEKEVAKAEGEVEDEDEEEKDEEEVDALKELERLERELKQEEAPTMGDDTEE